jgi:hypothetical protein
MPWITRLKPEVHQPGLQQDTDYVVTLYPNKLVGIFLEEKRIKILSQAACQFLFEPPTWKP